MADQANLKCHIELLPYGLKFRLKGFSDSLPKYIDRIFEKLTEFDVEKHGGERIFLILQEKGLVEY